MNALIFLFIVFGYTSSFASTATSKADSHNHDEESTEHKEDKEHDHSDSEDHHAHDSKTSQVDKNEAPPHDDHGDEHAHEEGEKDEHAHGKEEKDEHGHEEGGEEENSAIGPGKGITEKSENGFKLSEKAIKNFDIKTMVATSNTIELVRSALVEVRDQKYVYRMRDGWIKKVQVRVLSKEKSKVVLEISDVRSTDLIITGGAGFVRTAEIITEEGVSHGHSH